ncbi:response regulator [Massilia endophytica]|uniref:response regulator n=1 Tax=Massilia endophytica TaxID=2899220 RepID=UPI001E43034C|nr:response regulator [Massilia endophytica]UGQ47098.1 response regulator [Massilia endophytica]
MNMTDALQSLAPGAHAVPKVLHVDRDETAALILATLIVPETQVSHAASLGDAAVALAEEHYALIVLDPDLPDGDGYELVRSLRARGDHTPVLLYTATHPDLHHDAHAFLPKPWTSPRQLWQAVSYLLKLEGAPAALEFAA